MLRTPKAVSLFQQHRKYKQKLSLDDNIITTKNTYSSTSHKVFRRIRALEKNGTKILIDGEQMNIEKNSANERMDEVNLTETISEDDNGKYLYEGFCIDLLRKISEKVGFDYRIELVPDGKYGVFDYDTGEWNGIVRQLMDKVSCHFNHSS